MSIEERPNTRPSRPAMRRGSQGARALIWTAGILLLLATAPTVWSGLWYLTHSRGIAISGDRVRLPWRWIRIPSWIAGEPDSLIKLPYFTSLPDGSIFSFEGGGPREYSGELHWYRQHGYSIVTLPNQRTGYCAKAPAHPDSGAAAPLILNCEIDGGRRKLILIGEPSDLGFFMDLAQLYSQRNANAPAGQAKPGSSQQE